MAESENLTAAECNASLAVNDASAAGHDIASGDLTGIVRDDRDIGSPTPQTGT
jgi:hypothetical protein